eukprot:3365704-Pleurochrysis_carterae.AAC.3
MGYAQAESNMPAWVSVHATKGTKLAVLVGKRNLDRPLRKAKRARQYHSPVVLLHDVSAPTHLGSKRKDHEGVSAGKACSTARSLTRIRARRTGDGPVPVPRSRPRCAAAPSRGRGGAPARAPPCASAPRAPRPSCRATCGSGSGRARASSWSAPPPSAASSCRARAPCIAPQVRRWPCPSSPSRGPDTRAARR